jgi:pimeloyl-ACP methyl ester carboxylesterase
MKLATSVTGEGKPLVLIHGLFGRARNLGIIARGFSDRYRVISLDLRNHGASPQVPGMAYADMARDVAATLADLNALPACVLGHSMGGKTAMMLALMQPEAVEKLCVVDIAPRVYGGHNRQVSEALLSLPLDRPMTRADADAMLAPAVPDAAMRGFLLQNFKPGEAPGWSIGLRNIVDGMEDICGWPDQAATFTGPSLLVTGALSDYVTEADRADIVRCFPAARIMPIEGAGHWVHADKPAELVACLEGFLK